MDIKIESTEPDRKPSKLQPPTDYSSRGARIKLLTLVGSLMLVLVLMNEARKPANWKWMGFDNQGTQIEEANPPKSFVVEEAQYEPRSNTESEQQPADEKNLSEIQSEDDISQPPAIDKNDPADVDQVSIGPVSLAQPEFYQLLFKQLELDEQRGLFAALRELRGRSFSNELEFNRYALVSKMDELAKIHLSEMLNDLSLIEEGEPKRDELNFQLQKMQLQWEQHLKPALAGEPVNDTLQQRTIQALQSVMDEAAYSIVTDRSAPTWASDDPAWLRTWERILNVSKDWQTIDETTPIQLKAESKFYRGKPVSMQGELRGVEILKTRNNPMGIQQYYSLWIRPQESAIQPFNVYVTQLPELIELSEDRFTPFESLQVNLVGAFFKVRTYEDASGQVSETPLVFAKTVEVVATTREEVAAIPVRGEWKPSQGLLAVFFVGMPLLAIVIAYYVYRGTTSRKLRPGATVNSQINDTLNELGSDPNVQTVQQKLANMENERQTK